MSDRFTLAFGIHNHQPVGNFDSVFAEAHERAYAPFLELVAQFPTFQFSLHQSGILWGWQAKHRPAYLDGVRELVARGQVELLTGGFYEPILPGIPERDCIGQIRLLDDFLSQTFGVTPTGAWLAERVWEAPVARTLAQAGVRYIPVDDTHFLCAGLPLASLNRPFVTEYDGHAIRALPIQKRLRYLIPFGKVTEVIDELKRQRDANPGGVAVYADDGEKFGVWPKTYAHCYGDHWLKDFFEALERECAWLDVRPLATAAERHADGPVYFPSASYAEMLEWALPADALESLEQFQRFVKANYNWEDAGRFVRGGVWRGFQRKYPESNFLQKRMLRVSGMLEDAESSGRFDSATLTQARQALYESQCNCPYWHGVFGGLYLPHLRQAVWSRLITAEDALAPRAGVTIERGDYDCDGAEEALVTTPLLFVTLTPEAGGTIRELCHRRFACNLTDTMTRRRESYHAQLSQAVVEAKGASPTDNAASIHDVILAKEPHLDRVLTVDWYLRRLLIDHFLPTTATPEDFRDAVFVDEGDFALGAYELEECGSEALTLTRKGTVRRGERVWQVTVRKKICFTVRNAEIRVEYTLINHGPGQLTGQLGVENCINFQAGHAHDRYVCLNGARATDSFLDALTSHDQISRVALIDEWRGLGIGVTLDSPTKLWRAPIFTVSLSEGGFEKVYQGTALLSIWDVALEPGKPQSIAFSLTVAPARQLSPVSSDAGAPAEFSGAK